MPARAVLLVCGRLLRSHWKRASAAIGASLVGALSFGAVDPLLQKYLIDSLAAGRMRAFLLATVLLAASGLTARALAYLAAVSTQELKSAIGQRSVIDSLATFYRVPYGAVATQERGYFVNRIFDEPTRFAGDLVDTIVTGARALAVLVAAASVALWLSWEVTVGVTLVVPLLLRRARTGSDHAAEFTGHEGESEAALKGALGRGVEAYKTVALFDLDRHVIATIRCLLGTYQSTVNERVRSAARFHATSGIMMSAAELVVTTGAALQVVRGELSVGGLFAFMGAYFRVITAINSLAALAPAIGKVNGSLARLEAFEHLATHRPVHPAHTGVDIVDLSFAVDGRHVLRNVDFRLSRGERVLVLGQNGSGKSTLAHIIAGFLDGVSGEQRRPDQHRISALLLPFGFVPGTVRDNVKFDLLPDDQRERFLSLASELGLQGRLDQDPGTLSQGEQRKLQVLMTLQKKADFYLFDEPLSNVDAASKQALMRAILDHTQGSGLIVIMHGDEEFRQNFDREVDMGSFSWRESPTTC